MSALCWRLRHSPASGPWALNQGRKGPFLVLARSGALHWTEYSCSLSSPSRLQHTHTHTHTQVYSQHQGLCLKWASTAKRKRYSQLLRIWFGEFLSVERVCLHTCVLLRHHGSVDDSLKGSDPVLLLRFGFTSKQELPVWGFNGDPVLPVVSLGRGRQSGYHGIAVLFTADEHLATCICILKEWV